MGRMLEALRQIGTKSPPPLPASKAAAARDVSPSREPDAVAPPETAPFDRAAAVLALQQLAIELWPPWPAGQSALAIAAPDEEGVTREVAVLECPPPEVAERPPVTRASPIGWLGQSEAMPQDPLTRVSPTSLGPLPAYAALAERIRAGGAAGTPRLLMFTSPENGAGKTSVLIRLAWALAEQADGGLLVVDANLCSPDLATRLGIEAPWGLADVVLGVASWRQVVRPVGAGLWSVLPGRRFSTPDARLPESFNLDPLLLDLRNHFPLILMDAASLAHPEAAAFSRHCDGTYLVVRLGHTARCAAAAAVRVLHHCGGRLLGTVVVEG